MKKFDGDFAYHFNLNTMGRVKSLIIEMFVSKFHHLLTSTNYDPLIIHLYHAKIVNLKWMYVGNFK